MIVFDKIEIKCFKCGILKNENEFRPSQLKLKNPKCKECINSRKRELYREKNPFQEKVYHIPENSTHKICPNCKKLKSREEYPPSRFLPIYGNCRECLKKWKKEYRENNLDKINKYNKNYREENKDNYREWSNRNKEKLIDYRKQYVIDHREDINERIRNKRNTNQYIKMRTYISNSVRFMIKSMKSFKKYQSIIDKLEYGIEELIIHIENQFSLPENLIDDKVWMTWKNWGVYNRSTWNDNDPSTWTWQLDHITPQSDLPYDSMDHPNFRRAWALENLRPFSAKQNYLDGVRRTRHSKGKI